ncbi:arylsulfatase B-like [Watersipora subatra]|uniref:arylsulfatase B-like n=1 Tax=Watersipora subatra TaxID=2589382 RepID=UPI00355B3F16
MGGLLLCLLVLVLETQAHYFRDQRAPSISSARDTYRDYRVRKPNIVYIMSDDMGWNDVSFHNEKVKTPNLNALWAKGIELTQSYALPQCTPTRSSFMTGRYPSNNGLQTLVVVPESRSCLPLEHKTIYEHMKNQGYVTKHVGKWHLGSCDESCLPEARGVDQFRGILAAGADYFNWTLRSVVSRRVDGQPSTTNIGTHLAIQDARDAREMILDHRDNPNPLFMWITPNAPNNPLENTDNMFNVHNFLDATNPEQRSRRLYLGLVSAFDDIVGATLSALEEAGMDDNTIIVFSSDNGGADPSTEFPGFHHYANNYPLRNGKGSFTEGGVRVPTIYYDPRLHPSTRGTSRDFLVHVVDWMPTFVHLSKLGRMRNFRMNGIDGKSQLANLGSDYNSPERRKYNIRSEMLVSLSDATVNFVSPSTCATEDAAYRWRDYKLIYGEQYYGPDPSTKPTSWPKPQESPELPEINGDSCMRVVNGERVARCLFNVIADPSETRNLYDEMPGIVARLITKIEAAKRTAVKPVYRPTLGFSNTTVRAFGDYFIPRHDFCIPFVDFPLEPVDSSCY